MTDVVKNEATTGPTFLYMIKGQKRPPGAPTAPYIIKGQILNLKF
jgi:hypothetical protein